jgi:glycosyltransferase involved in cell wall biosynthesis
MQVKGFDSKKLAREMRENILKRRKEQNVINVESLGRWDETCATPGGKLPYIMVKGKALIQRGIRRYIEPILSNPYEFNLPPHELKKHSSNIQVHQLHQTASLGDAIGNDMLEIFRILRSCGYDSDIYTKHPDPKLSRIVRNYSEYRKISSPNNILLIHYSTGYGQDIFDFVKSLADKKVLIYHNITPPAYLRGYNNSMAALSEKGLEQIKKFKDIVIAAWADSEYNRKELERFGFRRTAVLPIILNFDKFKKFNSRIYEKFNDGKTNILFVGRLIPNKKIEDLIRIFYYYTNYINPNSRLILVGSASGTELYHRKLVSLAKKLKIEGKVMFTGKVSDEDLSAYYRVATNFLCMSEHEGFCIPLLEAMFFKIPVIAYNSTAVPFTMGDSGVLINKKDYEEIAELINLVNSDKKLRNAVIKSQNARLRNFSHENAVKRLTELTDEIRKL